ncbi:MAG: DUF3368 domain-containing protein, partial [Magnetococcales bacterium]|nr:DUF3368 domain-containing protein [Magnetococcales bacterium]
MTENPVICNSGPLIALASIGKLDLLYGLYGNIIVPEEVFKEVVEAGDGRPGALEVETLEWLQCLSLTLPPEPLLIQELGPGESAVIALAFQCNARFVLIDERRARRIAEHA